ncbi:MAG: M23 family metallopeptidase [candidate division Zixibacteria bacterium]|nr:M23 family metallopeptidase [candidate division Zixibacteria bacterium]
MSKKQTEMNKRGITVSIASSDRRGGLVLRIPAGILYLLAALPVGFFAVLLLSYLFFPIPAGYKVNGAESSAVVERLSFIEKELALSHEMASRMARLVGIELAQKRGKKDSVRKERPGFAILAGDENGARIFPLDGRVEPKADRIVIRFEKKDTVRASGSGVVAEVVHNSLVNWMVTIQHKNGYLSTYAGNLSPFVKKGDVLRLGEALGLATPPRFGSGKLEFGVFKAGQPVNPFAAFLDKTIDASPIQGRKPPPSEGVQNTGVSNS